VGRSAQQMRSVSSGSCAPLAAPRNFFFVAMSARKGPGGGADATRRRRIRGGIPLHSSPLATKRNEGSGGGGGGRGRNGERTHTARWEKKRSGCEKARQRDRETERQGDRERGGRGRGANPPTWNASRRLRKISSVGVIIKKYVSPQTYARTTLGAGGPPPSPSILPAARAKAPLFLLVLLTRRLFLRPRAHTHTHTHTHKSAGGHSSRTSLVRHVLRAPRVISRRKAAAAAAVAAV
jgi:hypothetical protein